jgi:hypothetical protein
MKASFLVIIFLIIYLQENLVQVESICCKKNWIGSCAGKSRCNSFCCSCEGGCGRRSYLYISLRNI